MPSSCVVVVVVVVVVDVIVVGDVLGDVLGDERRALAENDGVIESAHSTHRVTERDHVPNDHARTTA